MNTLNFLPALVLATGSMIGAPPAHAASAPTCHGAPATIVGTSGDDVLRGTKGPDVIVGRAGDDIIKGLGGDDLVCAGDGADRVQGGSGDDRLYGQRDALERDRGGTFRNPDLLDGGAGDDLLDVGTDRRRVDQDAPYGLVTYGSARVGVTVDLGAGDGFGTATGVGRDRIVLVPAGSCAAPPCFGLVVEGSPHDDTLLGSAAPDHLVGGWGDDHLEGREGDDELDAEGRGQQFGADADTVSGGPGADRIIGWYGHDVLSGDEGDDHVGSLAPVAATVQGGAGDDHVFATVTRSGFVLDGGDGRDDAYLARPATARATDDAGAEVEVDMAEGTVSRDDRVLGTVAGLEEVTLDSHLAWHYVGTDGPDVVTGGYYWPLRAETFAGDDRVVGGAKRDRIDAGEGHDVVDGMEARDTCLNAEVVERCEVLSE